MLKIGLTGGIGSGKTTVANRFSALNVPIIDADVIAHEITAPHQTGYDKIVAHFGPALLSANGHLDRAQLREIVFKNPKEKHWLEATLHPVILETMQQKLQTLQAPYCILVIPLLVETANFSLVDRVLVIDAPESLQIQRTQQRSQLSEAQIRAIIKTQCTSAKRLKAADDVIVNDGDTTVLQQHVEQLHLKYLEMA